MSRRGLCLLLLLSLLAPLALAQQPEFREFLQRLKAVYAELEDLQAIVTILEITPEGREKEWARVRIATLVKQKILRLEFLDPPEMRGTILAFKGDELSLYFPVNNLIVVEKISETHLYYPLLELLNLDLERIIAQLQQKGFTLAVSQEVICPGLVRGGNLANLISQLAAGKSIKPLSLSLSLTQSRLDSLPLGIRVSFCQLGDYQLVASLSQDKVEEKFLISVNSLDLIPRRLRRQSLRQIDGKVNEEMTVYLASEIQINRGLTEKELLALPKDAAIMRR